MPWRPWILALAGVLGLAVLVGRPEDAGLAPSAAQASPQVASGVAEPELVSPEIEEPFADRAQPVPASARASQDGEDPHPHAVVVRTIDRRGRPLPYRLGFREVQLVDASGRFLAGSRGKEEPFHLVTRSTLDPAEPLWLILDPGPTYAPDQRDLHFLDPQQPGGQRRAISGTTGVAVQLGDRVDLVLAAGGSLRGRVRRAAAGPSARVDGVQIEDMRRPEPGWVLLGTGLDPVFRVSIGDDGTFEVPRLDAGPKRMLFLVGWSPVHALEDVVVALEEACADPRLIEVDLASSLRELRIQVVDGAGVPIDDAAASLRVGQEWQTSSAGADGVVALVRPTGEGLDPDQALYVHAEDFVPVEVSPPWDGRTVVLMPAQPLALRTTPYTEDIGSHGYWFRLRREDAPPGSQHLWCTELPFGDCGGAATDVIIPGPGRYELEVLVLVRMGSRFGRSPGDRYQPTGSFIDIAQGTSEVLLAMPDDLERFHPSFGD